MIPNLTDDERRKNLDKAMQLRQMRAAIRKRLKSGEMSIEAFFALADSGSEAASGMRAKLLVSAMPKVGFASTQRIMKALGISEERRVRGLGSRQREMLVGLFGGDR